MARLSRLVVPGAAHHLVHRTVAGTVLFADQDELRLLKEALQRASREHRVWVHAYRLASAELQLLATPPAVESLGRMMQALARFYVPALNRRRGRAGALWQGRFRAAPVGGAEPLLDCMRYIERRVPATDIPTPRPLEPEVTSEAAHTRGTSDSLLAPVPIASAYWSLGNTPFEREAAYGALLEQVLPTATLRAIESTTLKGWAFGTGEFLASLEALGRRRSVPLKAGRPRRPTERSDR